MCVCVQYVCTVCVYALCSYHTRSDGDIHRFSSSSRSHATRVLAMSTSVEAAVHRVHVEVITTQSLKSGFNQNKIYACIL